MADQTGHRFIVFISRQEEMAEYQSLKPRSDFVFTSFSCVGPDVLTIDPQRPSAMFAEFNYLHSQQPFSAVLNRKEKCVIPAAQLALTLELPPITLKPEVARDKYLMRRLLNDGAVFPRTVLIRRAEDLRAVDSSMFPGVLKPRFGFNSRSVVLVAGHNALRESYAEQHYLYSRLPKQDGTSNDFVFEQLIPGTEHNVETLMKDGRAIFHLMSDKRPMTAPYFVETGDTMPSLLAPRDQAACIAATERALMRMEIQNGWTHTEVKLDGGRVIVVECAARMGGGYFENLFNDVYDIQRMQMLVEMYCGAELSVPPIARAYAAARRIVVYGARKRWKLANATELFESEHVKLLWPEAISAISRELAGPPDDFNNTLCEFVVLSPSAAEATSLVDRILSQAYQNLSAD